MNALRRFSRWVSGHRIVSLLSIIVVVGIIAAAASYRKKSEGELTQPIGRGRIVESVYGIGTVTASRSYDLKPGTISSITDLYVSEGDAVTKDKPLLKLDQLVFRAPFAGTVTYLPYKNGESVFVQSIVLSLVDLKSRYLLVSMEQQGALRVRPKQKVYLSFDSIRQRSYDGTVTSVYSNGGHFFARIDVAELPPEILPGMTADVAIEVARRDDALVIPAAALDHGRVWVKRAHSLIKEVPVETGVVDNDRVEIVSGAIEPGDRLLIRKRASP